MTQPVADPTPALKMSTEARPAPVPAPPPPAPALPITTPASAERSPLIVEAPRYRMLAPGSGPSPAATAPSAAAPARTGGPTPAPVAGAAPGTGTAPGPGGRGESPGGAASGWGAPRGDASSGNPLGLSTPPPAPQTVASGKPLDLRLPRVDTGPNAGQGPVRQPSLSEMANAQLRGQRKDPLADGIKEAGKEDCIGPNSGGTGLLSPLVAAYKAATDKCK